MKQFRCGDVMPGCAARFEGQTDQDILLQVGRHVGEQHGLEDISRTFVEVVTAKISERRLMDDAPFSNRWILAVAPIFLLR